MSLLPLFIDIKDKPCLIAGGGKIAARKLKMLCKAEASVTVIAPAICDEIKSLCENHSITLHQRKFSDSDIGNQRLIIAATSDVSLNKHISNLAKENDILVNVADDFKRGDVVLPSVIDRSPIQIAVTTGGASPVLARLLRRNLERCTPSAYGSLASLVEKYRQEASNTIQDGDSRRRFWEEVLQGPISEMVLAGKVEEAEESKNWQTRISAQTISVKCIWLEQVLVIRTYSPFVLCV